MTKSQVCPRLVHRGSGHRDVTSVLVPGLGPPPAGDLGAVLGAQGDSGGAPPTLERKAVLPQR